MIEAFAHAARIELAPGADPGAPGGAITIALCGSIDHEPPCPLAAHYTELAEGERDVVGNGFAATVRVLFATDPAAKDRVRALIREALEGGVAETPGGQLAHWRLLSDKPEEVAVEERDHATRLVASTARS